MRCATEQAGYSQVISGLYPVTALQSGLILTVLNVDIVVAIPREVIADTSQLLPLFIFPALASNEQEMSVRFTKLFGPNG